MVEPRAQSPEPRREREFDAQTRRQGDSGTTLPRVAASPCRRVAASGFTLVELLVVVTIIGILAGIAVVNVRHARRKAAETVLKADLAQMRKAIDDFYADKQRYPSSLQEIVEAKYMRSIPKDPITESAETWIEVQEEPDPNQSFTATDTAGPGVVDVKSGAEGETMDDPPIPYSEL